jgi:uncharacterized SAM-binding protein YcdF (DUF218 family)
MGIEAWKPALTALSVPPVPLIVLALVGAWLVPRRRGLGHALVVAACVGLWLASTTATGELLVRHLVRPPTALDLAREAAVLSNASARNATAVVVLGGGRQPFAPEYGTANLTPTSIERLRFGVWLARRLDVPLAFTGGVGHGGRAGTTEAQIAGRIAVEEFRRPLRWLESASRDTRENAVYTVPLLARDGVRRIVLVTHGWHMPRALRAFREAAERNNLAMDVVPAPMALAPADEAPMLRFLPSAEGTRLVRLALREWLGRMAGA